MNILELALSTSSVLPDLLLLLVCFPGLWSSGRTKMLFGFGNTSSTEGLIQDIEY